MLNSDRILQQYGSYGVQVLRQENGVRRSGLYSQECAGNRIRDTIESHHPDYLSEMELSRRYAADNVAPLGSAEIEALVGLVLD